MKRADKITLLTRILQGENPEANKKHLTHAIQTGARGLILIDDLDDPEPGNPMGDNSTVTFNDKGKDHRMTLAEAHKYAKRNFINTLLVVPANGRD